MGGKKKMNEGRSVTSVAKFSSRDGRRRRPLRTREKTSYAIPLPHFVDPRFLLFPFFWGAHCYCCECLLRRQRRRM